MKKRFNLSMVIVPALIAVGAFANAIADNAKNKKIDELIEKIDNLDSSSEEVES